MIIYHLLRICLICFSNRKKYFWMDQWIILGNVFQYLKQQIDLFFPCLCPYKKVKRRKGGFVLQSHRQRQRWQLFSKWPHWHWTAFFIDWTDVIFVEFLLFIESPLMLVIDSGFASIGTKMFDFAFFATLQQGVSIKHTILAKSLMDWLNWKSHKEDPIIFTGR